MVHGDDKGLVLPPKIAPSQVVVMPIALDEKLFDQLVACARQVYDELRAAGVRVELDDSTQHNSGFKRSHWEQKGVPIRIESGPKELKNNAAFLCMRDNGQKSSAPRASLVEDVRAALDEMQARMLAKATTFRDEHISHITKWEEFMPALDKRHLILAPWCK